MYSVGKMVQSPRVTAHTHDDNVHEIQLNGKQLVFLFMAATVVSVVIFLSGVMVGRGVRAERLAAAAATDALAEPTADAVTPPPADPPSASIDLTKADAPPTAGESGAPATTDAADEIRPDRPAPKKPAPVTDNKPVQMASNVKPAAAPEAAKPVATREPAPTAPVVAKPAARPASAVATPVDNGTFAVQVAALNTRGEADTIAKRLSSKGYAAYVQVPSGTNSVFRVRVGSYKTRREAEAVATKLQKEEHVKPWVTR